MRRLLAHAVLMALVAGLSAASSASAQQSVNVSLGGLVPRGENTRATGDVIVGNLSGSAPLLFGVSDFNGATVGGEWLVGLGANMEAGLGVGFYQRAVPAVNAGFVNADGSEIESTLALRVVPFSATIRFLPLGRQAPIVPYFGAGAGVFAWHYSESGDFLAADQATIIRGDFVDSGTAVGPVILGGVRVPVGSVDIGGEIRYQAATGKFTTDASGAPLGGFAGTGIDLGGMNYLFTCNIRF